MNCSIGDCTKQATKRGWCIGHYTRWIRHGDPLGGGLPRGLAREGYFWPKVNKDGPVPDPATCYRPVKGPCWLWKANRNRKGYGMFADGGKGSIGAHRFVYELLVGPIPDGYEVDHLCRVHACVNPAHLEAVTPEENQRRGESFSGVNGRRSRCAQGHELTADNSYGYKGRRQCKTCARQKASARSADPAVRSAFRDRYATARAAGLSPDESRKAATSDRALARATSLLSAG